ncbi:MAG: transaldolase [Candidatus Competibacterales bacterium]
MNPLQKLRDHGQSLWIDYLRRHFVESNDLARLVAEDGLEGLTSNPVIFHQAISGSDDYREALNALARDPAIDALTAYEHLAVEDIRSAADVLAPIYRRSAGRAGLVSLEVSPHLAWDTTATCAEARRLWGAIDRPNALIKVPATPPGTAALETLVAEGISVNATLIFSQSAYRAVAEAYLAGLEQAAAKGLPLAATASVASFFISRIDSAVDGLIDRRVQGGDPAAEALTALRGQVAIANAKGAYDDFQTLLASPRWQALARAGAKPQRLLWASTGVKDPRYRDVRYIEELIGPETVNTVPPATLDAFKDHGQVATTLNPGDDTARQALAQLAQLGIDLDSVCAELLDDGIRRFADAFDALLTAEADALAAARRVEA